MSLSDDLTTVKEEGIAQLNAAVDAVALEAVRIAFLGRKGRLKDLQKAFKEVPPEEKRVVGPLFNEVTSAINECFEQRQADLEQSDDAVDIDVTEPREHARRGSIHPISQVALEVE